MPILIKCLYLHHFRFWKRLKLLQIMKRKIYVLSTSNGVVNVYIDTFTAYLAKRFFLRDGYHDVKVRTFEIDI